jgi:hypothetical protein
MHVNTNHELSIVTQHTLDHYRHLTSAVVRLIQANTSIPSHSPSATMTIPAPEDPVTELQQIYHRYSSNSELKEHANTVPATNEITNLILRTSKNITQNQVMRGNGSLLGSEIRKLFWPPKVGEAVTHVFDMMLPEELEKLREEGKLAGELLNARSLARSYALDVELDGVIHRVVKDGYVSDDDSEYVVVR